MRTVIVGMDVLLTECTECNRKSDSVAQLIEYLQRNDVKSGVVMNDSDGKETVKLSQLFDYQLEDLSEIIATKKSYYVDNCPERLVAAGQLGWIPVYIFCNKCPENLEFKKFRSLSEFHTFLIQEKFEALQMSNSMG
ncbi:MULTISPECIES: hypothetical protein [Enterococcus]|uniref:hypothetical protein n=1 Tax=Enterococcus TaxID=1350 RepID=UPI002073CB9E|nr:MULTISPECIES: hypothetical protein [Enterococcus]EME8140048.1 hypothetical protein [Enterococcus faecium]MCM6935306.1 hypothetical protein [Enterococcus faecalis]